MKTVIGVHLPVQHAEMHRLREAWEEAEALGVDRIYFNDHFHAQILDAESMHGAQALTAVSGRSFEATMVQAAAAATTARAEIGCTVHAIGFRNPNLLADIARTIDHISNGRFILGLGAGYLKEEYDDYGYDNFGTLTSRMQDLIDGVAIIKARYEKLNPKPLRKIPLLIATMGEKMGMPLAAKHADIWNVVGSVDKIRHKMEVFRMLCAEIGRDPAEIEIMGTCTPNFLPDNSFDAFYRDLGIRSISVIVQGPKFDLGLLRELLQWNKALG